MQDSYNYSGFSSSVVMMRRRRDKAKSRMVVIAADDRKEGDLDRFCPPYLLQGGKLRADFK